MTLGSKCLKVRGAAIRDVPRGAAQSRRKTRPQTRTQHTHPTGPNESTVSPPHKRSNPNFSDLFAIQTDEWHSNNLFLAFSRKCFIRNTGMYLVFFSASKFVLGRPKTKLGCQKSLYSKDVSVTKMISQLNYNIFSKLSRLLCLPREM